MNTIEKIQCAIVDHIVEDVEPQQENMLQVYVDLMSRIRSHGGWLSTIDNTLRQMQAGIIGEQDGLDRINTIISTHDTCWEYVELTNLIRSLQNKPTKYSVKDAAVRMKLSEEHVRRLIRQKKLPAELLGGQYLIGTDTLMNYRKE